MGKVLMSGGGGGVGSDEVTATKDKVLTGQTYLGSDTDDEIGTGTIPIRTPVNQSLGINGTIALPYGYYPSDSKITQNIATRGAATITPGKTAQTIGAGQYLSGAQTIASLGGNAPASMVHPSYTFSSDNAGRAQKGTMATLGAQTVVPTNVQRVVNTSGKYMTGNVTVQAVTNLIAANIKKGVVVGGITGTFEGYTTSPLNIYNRGVWSGVQNTGLSTVITTGNSFRVYDTYMGFYGTSTPNRPPINARTNQTINITAYKYLKVTFDAGSAGTARNQNLGRIGISTNASAGINSYTATATKDPLGANDYVVVLDISNYAGNYYLYIESTTRVDGGYGGKVVVGIYNIQLTNN